MFVAVVPFLNEADFLPGLLDDIAKQARRPDRLLLVDDGSTDASAVHCEHFVAGNSYARLLRRREQGQTADRLETASEFAAFRSALLEAGDDWTVAVKLDADLELPRNHFEFVVHHLETHPRVGIAGAFLSVVDESGERRREPHPVDHVRGPNKFYRRECWEQIRPIPAILGWDTIDEIGARMEGWETSSVEIPGGDPIHRRPTGSYDGSIRGFMRWGQCAYAVGNPAIAVVAGGVRRIALRPFVFGGLAYVAGWARAGFRRAPRASKEIRLRYRAEQRARLVEAVRRPFRTLFP